MKTQNGFTRITNPSDPRITTVTVGGVSFRVLKEAEQEFRALLEFLNSIEPFSEAGWDGGYADRPVRGSTTVISNHASASAVDVNASQHSLGVRDSGWTLSQRLRIYAWLKVGVGRCFAWGNMYHNRADGMHFELTSPAALAKYGKGSAPSTRDRVTGVQAAIGMPLDARDGKVGPLSRTSYRGARAKCRAHPVQHRTMVRNVRRALGLSTLTPVWNSAVDKAAAKLGFTL